MTLFTGKCNINYHANTNIYSRGDFLFYIILKHALSIYIYIYIYVKYFGICDTEIRNVTTAEIDGAKRGFSLQEQILQDARASYVAEITAQRYFYVMQNKRFRWNEGKSSQAHSRTISQKTSFSHGNIIHSTLCRTLDMTTIV